MKKRDGIGKNRVCNITATFLIGVGETPYCEHHVTRMIKGLTEVTRINGTQS